MDSICSYFVKDLYFYLNGRYCFLSHCLKLGAVMVAPPAQLWTVLPLPQEQTSCFCPSLSRGLSLLCPFSSLCPLLCFSLTGSQSLSEPLRQRGCLALPWWLRIFALEKRSFQESGCGFMLKGTLWGHWERAVSLVNTSRGPWERRCTWVWILLRSRPPRDFKGSC